MKYGHLLFRKPTHCTPSEYMKFSEKQHKAATKRRYLVKMNMRFLSWSFSSIKHRSWKLLLQKIHYINFGKIFV